MYGRRVPAGVTVRARQAQGRLIPQGQQVGRRIALPGILARPAVGRYDAAQPLLDLLGQVVRQHAWADLAQERQAQGQHLLSGGDPLGTLQGGVNRARRGGDKGLDVREHQLGPQRYHPGPPIDHQQLVPAFAGRGVQLERLREERAQPFSGHV